MKLYTKTGDTGTTSLYQQGRKPKTAAIFNALGTLDELNAVLGFVTAAKNKRVSGLGLQLQNDLFDLGSFVAGRKFDKSQEQIWRQKISHLETEIDKLDASVAPLTNFILPGGSLSSCWVHLARAVCRRAERDMLKVKPKVPAVFTVYLNRTSDLLFALARYSNKVDKHKEIVWKV